ncbi:MAG: peptide-methionine (S)-S-oxide reductase MsrA [Peptoniphilus sp.]|nr:peptide-methionine (S)-S-oxide reductase MsrA [Peptoniphilus sp.]MDY3118016.1 peptide-methionine (S)-S-oxide reductase MsrA [Peptoniphilus sp.]
MAEIILAGGCFWGVEEYFRRTEGVTSTTVGYVNSDVPCPTYDDLCYGKSKAAEGVLIHYDPSVISRERVVDLFYKIIDPYSYFRQGNDVGRQYRTGLYYRPGDEEAKTFYEADKARRQSQSERKIWVEVAALENFTEAEDYHQKYLLKNPGGYCHIPLPKKSEK